MSYYTFDTGCGGTNDFYKQIYDLYNNHSRNNLTYYYDNIRKEQKQDAQMIQLLEKTKLELDYSNKKIIELEAALRESNIKIRYLQEALNVIKADKHKDKDLDLASDENSTDVDSCSICMERKKKVLFEPCKHVVTCNKCANDLKEMKCPVCRVDIKKMMTIFI